MRRLLIYLPVPVSVSKPRSRLRLRLPDRDHDISLVAGLTGLTALIKDPFCLCYYSLGKRIIIRLINDQVFLALPAPRNPENPTHFTRHTRPFLHMASMCVNVFFLLFFRFSSKVRREKTRPEMEGRLSGCWGSEKWGEKKREGWSRHCCCPASMKFPSFFIHIYFSGAFAPCRVYAFD